MSVAFQPLHRRDVADEINCRIGILISPSRARAIDDTLRSRAVFVNDSAFIP
jgi:hypothetical protein